MNHENETKDRFCLTLKNYSNNSTNQEAMMIMLMVQNQILP